MQTKPYVILVGIDFSELSERALDEALLLSSKRSDAELHALSIVPVPSLTPGYALPASGLLDEAEILSSATERLHSHVQTRLEKFEAGHPEFTPSSFVSHVEMGAPAHGIAQLASDIGADLVVIGTHNRRGAERLLLGSVAEATVRYAHCPVLVIPGEVKPEEPQDDEVRLTPPCSECVRARRESGGRELWCAQHRERHGRRHTYHQSDRSGAETNFPLVIG